MLEKRRATFPFEVRGEIELARDGSHTLTPHDVEQAIIERLRQRGCGSIRRETPVIAFTVPFFRALWVSSQSRWSPAWEIPFVTAGAFRVILSGSEIAITFRLSLAPWLVTGWLTALVVGLGVVVSWSDLTTFVAGARVFGWFVLAAIGGTVFARLSARSAARVFVQVALRDALRYQVPLPPRFRRKSPQRRDDTR